MRAQLLELLRCPVCSAESGFDLQPDSTNQTEVYSGHVRCVDCGTRFPILQGCCDLLPHPSAAVQREREAQAVVERRALQSVAGYSALVRDDDAMREFILSLPGGYPDMALLAPTVEHALASLELTGSETVLDVGAGMCWTTADFAKRGCRAVALDISTLYMPRSRFFCDDGRYFDRVIADMTSFPVAAGKFDIVFANAALHHSPDLEKTWAEIARSLKPNGRAVLVNEPVAGRFEKRRVRDFGKDEIADGFNENIFRIGEWKRVIQAVGLKSRFEIPVAGIAEKAMARRAKEPKSPAFRLWMLWLLEKPAARFIVLLLRRLALHFYPFNVVIHAKKMASK